MARLLNLHNQVLCLQLNASGFAKAKSPALQPRLLSSATPSPQATTINHHHHHHHHHQTHLTQEAEVACVRSRFAPVSIDVPTLHRGLVEGRQAVRRMLQPYSRHVEAVFEPVIVPQLSPEQHRRLAVATAQLYAAGEGFWWQKQSDCSKECKALMLL